MLHNRDGRNRQSRKIQENSDTEAQGREHHTEKAVSVSDAAERPNKVRTEQGPQDLTKIVADLKKSFSEAVDGQGQAVAS